MLLWFAGLSFVLVVAVFRDPALDERLVMAAATLPAVLDLAVGGVRLLHTLAFPIGLLAVVMVASSTVIFFALFTGFSCIQFWTTDS